MAKMELAETCRQRAGNLLALEVLVEGARGLRDFSKLCDLKGGLARWLEAHCFLLRLLTPELLLLEDELVLGEGVE